MSDLPEAPTISGIHHLKFAVGDLACSQAFYESAMMAKRIAALDHARPDTGQLFGIILEVPGLGTLLELRLNANQASAQGGFDPVTLAVQKQADLNRWVDHLDRVGIEHSPILAGLIGWVLVIKDPEGRFIRFYTLETHGPEVPMTYDERWLGPL